MAAPCIYASVEWIWPDETIRINVPSAPEKHRRGCSYQEVVEILSEMGREGWEVVTAVCGGDWIYWTLRRSIVS